MQHFKKLKWIQKRSMMNKILNFSNKIRSDSALAWPNLTHLTLILPSSGQRHCVGRSGHKVMGSAPLAQEENRFWLYSYSSSETKSKLLHKITYTGFFSPVTHSPERFTIKMPSTWMTEVVISYQPLLQTTAILVKAWQI